MLKIRQAGPGDLAGVAAAHMELFPDDLSTFLGREFVERYYYGALLKEARGFGLLAYAGDDLAGFVFGAYDSDRTARECKRVRLRYTAAAALRHPFRAARWLRFFLGRRGALAGPHKAELVSLAVQKQFQGKGIARSLVDAFQQHLKGKGIGGCWTKTHSSAAARLYRSEGFEVVSTFNAVARTYTVLTWSAHD